MSEDKYKLIIESLDTLNNISHAMKIELANYRGYIKYLIEKNGLSELLEKNIDGIKHHLTSQFDNIYSLDYGISILKEYFIENERVNDLVSKLECFINVEKINEGRN
jgi:hypothetical protein